MTIGNALNFIKRGMNDDQLRKRLNKASGIEGIDQILQEVHLDFSYNEFDEAYHHRLVQCQEESEADQLKHFRLWWEMLTQIESGRACSSSCSGCGGEHVSK